MLSPSDENDLLIPLYASAEDEQPFILFAQRLQRRLRADALALARIDAGGGIRWHYQSAGGDIGRDFVAHLTCDDWRKLRANRLYRIEELEPPACLPFVALVQSYGWVDLRLNRLSSGPGAEIALLMARSVRSFDAGDMALLGRFAPHLASAAQLAERFALQRAIMSSAEHALVHADFGWIALNAQRNITQISAHAARTLTNEWGIEIGTGYRLPVADPLNDAVFAAYAERCIQGDNPPPQLIALRDIPPLLMLAIPAGDRANDISATIALGLLREPHTANPVRAAMFAREFGLGTGEARLADALFRGCTIAEAGRALGLTVETARFYSKQIYSKLGVRGQSELMIRLASSVSALC